MRHRNDLAALRMIKEGLTSQFGDTVNKMQNPSMESGQPAIFKMPI